MPRGLTTNQKAALAQRVKLLRDFVHLALPASDLRIWNGVGPIVADGETWQGVGAFGVIDGVRSSRSQANHEITIGLHGLPGAGFTASMVTETRGLRYQGRPLTVYLGICDPETGAIIDGLVPTWGGFADVMSFSIGATVSISLSSQHMTSIMRRANGLAASTNSHNARPEVAAGGSIDLFFEVQTDTMGIARPLV